MSIATMHVVKASDEGFDDDGGAWVTICVEHSTLINSETRALARAMTTEDFCDYCRGQVCFECNSSEPGVHYDNCSWL